MSHDSDTEGASQIWEMPQMREQAIAATDQAPQPDMIDRTLKRSNSQNIARHSAPQRPQVEPAVSAARPSDWSPRPRWLSSQNP